jgi:glucosamine kinase
MIDFLIGIDGGGSGTRACLARPDGSQLAEGHAGPSGLSRGVDAAWQAVYQAMSAAFLNAGISMPHHSRLAVSCGMAGAHVPELAFDFSRSQPGFGQFLLNTDAHTTWVGAHGGAPGAILAIGTGSVAMAVHADGQVREAGGWGFAIGDEGSGAWMGIQAVHHLQAVLDGVIPGDAFSDSVGTLCGHTRDAHFAWLVHAKPSAFAQLAPLVLEQAHDCRHAARILRRAGRALACLIKAIDPGATLPVALCGGLGKPLRHWLPQSLLQRCRFPREDSAHGALRLLLSPAANRSLSDASS